MTKKIQRAFIQFETYLGISLFFLFLAPIGDLSHWELRSSFFATIAFYFLLITVGIVGVSLFFSKYPQLKKRLPKLI